MRPAIPAGVPPELRELATSCLAGNATHRPPFVEITRRLQAYFKHAKSFMPTALEMTIAELEASEAALDDGKGSM